MATDRRLIEEWLPIGEIGIESLRERTPMTPFPAPNRLHVWWARRPLVVSRASILGCLLPATADREKFMHVLGIHGDPVKARRRIDLARRRGERFEGEAYPYKRAFTYVPTPVERSWIKSETSRLGVESPTVLDPTAGGGSIPFESVRLSLRTFSNDLNPVAALLDRATIELPLSLGGSLIREFETLAEDFVRKREERLSEHYPAEDSDDRIASNYLFARTIECPYCGGVVPLAPNLKLSNDGTGVRLLPQTEGKRICRFEIVSKASEHSQGTVSDGDSRCPFPDCHRVIDAMRSSAKGKPAGWASSFIQSSTSSALSPATKRTARKRLSGCVASALRGPRTTTATPFARA
jgi:putative DNA methylase